MSNKVGIISCAYSGLKLAAYQDFVGLIDNKMHHPLFDVKVTKLSRYLSNPDNSQPTEKEQYLVGLYPAVWCNNQFKVPMDLDSNQVFTLFNKARTLIHRLAKLERTNEALRESIKNTSGYRLASQHDKNLLIQRADLVKELFRSLPQFRVTKENSRTPHSLISYYNLLIGLVNGLINADDVRAELTAEDSLAITNEELDRVIKRKELLASGNFKLRDQHFSFLAIELGDYIAARSGKTTDTNELALMIKGFFTCDVSKLDRNKFQLFARIAREVLGNSSEAINQEAEDVEFIIRKIEQIESESNKIQGLLGGSIFEVNKQVNGIEYKIIETSNNTDEVFKDTLSGSISGQSLANKIAEIKARLAKK